jgi:hypothetical protein
MDGWVKPGHDGWCFVRAASAISFVKKEAVDAKGCKRD